MENMNNIEVSRSTVYFKMKFVKILEKCLRLTKFSLVLNFFEDYLKLIKELCKYSGNKLNIIFWY